MIVFRITREKYQNDLSGAGSKIFGGRWNPIGMNALYVSETKALAVLELLVHTSKDLVPPRYKILNIQIPFDEPNQIKTIEPLPKNWRMSPPLDELKSLGEDLLVKQNNLAMRIPSTIIPSEFNIVINPLHSNMKFVKIICAEDFEFDNRLLK